MRNDEPSLDLDDSFGKDRSRSRDERIKHRQQRNKNRRRKNRDTSEEKKRKAQMRQDKMDRDQKVSQKGDNPMVVNIDLCSD